MKAGERLKHILDIKPEESRDLRNLFLQSFFIGLATSFYFVATYSFLIKNTSIGTLPFAYIVSGATGFVLIWLYKKIRSRMGIVRTMYASVIAFAIVSLFVFFSFMRWSALPATAMYLAFAGFAFIFPFGAIFSINLGGLFLSIFDLGQSKRLMALMGTGETLASILAYFITPFITRILHGPEALLFLAGVAIIFTLLPLRRLVGTNEKLSQPVKAVKAARLDLSIYFKNRFYGIIALVTLVSSVAVYFIDYSYLVSVRFLSVESGIEAASIIALFFGIVKTGELLFSLFSGNIISARGMQFSLLLLPVLLCSASLFAALSSALLPGIAFFVLAFLMLNKWIDRVIRKAIESPAMRVLYQVTEPAERMQLQANNEGMVNQVSTALAGFILWLVANHVSADNTLGLLGRVALISFASFLVWTFLTSRLYHTYREQVRNFLRQRTHAPGMEEKANEKPASTIHQLSNKINDAASMLAKAGRPELLEMIVLYNPAAYTLLEKQEDISLQKRLAKVYFENDSYFSRTLILRYMDTLPLEACQQSLLSLIDLSDYTLKREILRLLNEKGYRAEKENLFRMQEMITGMAGELVWTQAARHDLLELEDEALDKALGNLESQLQHTLFEAMKTIYDKTAIETIQDTMYRVATRENQLFAMELLENTLQPPLKDLMQKVFDPSPWAFKEARLSNIMPVSNLSTQERLRDILMKDFKVVDLHVKQLALMAYSNIEKDSRLLDAFASSQLAPLRSTAQRLQGKLLPDPNAYEELNKWLDASHIIRLERWGAASEAQPATAHFNKNTNGTEAALPDRQSLSIALLLNEKQ